MDVREKLVELLRNSPHLYPGSRTGQFDPGRAEGGLTMAISNKKAVKAAKVIEDYCNEQKSCQNCIFRIYGCENWHCALSAFDLQDVLRNIEAKKKNRGYL